tara:strand:+ start:3281 stop:3955 length:675 start_codon:yes stop_codon:yes gene_type:complete
MVFKNILVCLALCVFSCNLLVAQQQVNIKRSVQIKMSHAHGLYLQGNVPEAQRLVHDSIEIILKEMRSGNIEPWMREAVNISMQIVKSPAEEINKTMKEIDLQVSIKKTVDAMRKPQGLPEPISKTELPAYFLSLERSKATMEFARSRNRFAAAGHFLGQRHGAVGYRPIISFFPQGDMMTAGPVIVSPDRRYVRVGISAAQSGITAVHTFNFSTGKYQKLGDR